MIDSDSVKEEGGTQGAPLARQMTKLYRGAPFGAASVNQDLLGNPTVASAMKSADLTEEEKAAERHLARKIDLHIVPIVFVLYLFCFIDRANIGNARLAGFERDLGLRGYDFNLVISMFYVAYIIFEIPSSIACKKVGPGKWIPVITFIFGILSICTAFVTSLSSACIVRFLLGAAESGMMPGISFYLSRWYRKDELVFRLSLYLVASPIAGACGGLLASAILKLDSIGSLDRWQMIFMIEGTITSGSAVIAFLILTDRPAVASWLTKEEKELAERRIVSENLTLTALDKMHRKTLLAGIFSFNTFMVGGVFFFNNITVQGIAVFLPTIVRTIYPHASTISQQLKTVPPNLLGGAAVLASASLAWKLDKRGPVLCCFVPLVMIGYSIFLGTVNAHARYAASFLVTSGAFAFGAIINSWAVANVTCDTARASALCTVVMMGNLGGLVASWTFLPKNAPRYHQSNVLNLAGSIIALVLLLSLLAYQYRSNKAHERGDYDDYLLKCKTQEEAEALGVKHPAFRYRY